MGKKNIITYSIHILYSIKNYGRINFNSIKLMYF